MSTGKNKMGFGSAVPRFLGLGCHPLLHTRPGTHRLSHIAPGCYRICSSRKIMSLVSRWSKVIELEEFSKNMGYHSKDLLKRKKEKETIRGPAWGEIPPPPARQGLTFTRSERFQAVKEKCFAVPGPGTYGKNHNPYTRFEEKSHSKGYSFSVLPSFEHYSRRPKSLNELSYNLPPNMFNIKGSVDELISKCISKKGPYDLFSGERFPDLPRQTVPFLRVADISNPCNRFKGVFSKYGRDGLKTFRLAWNCLPSEDINSPGPGHYNPYPPKQITQSPAPFNTGKNPRPSLKCKLHPPPTRYNIEYGTRIKGGGMRSVFLSKTERNIYKTNKCSWFE